MRTIVIGCGQTAPFFIYDGDGNRVKGTVGGTTVYIGNYFEWKGSTSTMVKYYYAGSTRIAMRTGSGTGTSGLKWLLGDHLGSTAYTAEGSSGAETGEVRYRPWGEDRYTEGATLTTFRFTGQRVEASLGLYYYGARFYDPALGRFVQADTIVPGAGNPQAWDRFAYALNNPTRYTDPTGHKICEEGDCKYGRSDYYGLRFKGTWTEDDKRKVIYAVQYVALKMAAHLKNMEAPEAFQAVYGSVTFEYGNCPECNGAGGYTYSSHDIRFADLSEDLMRGRNNVVHELGHAFKATLSYKAGINIYDELARKQAIDPLFPDRITFAGGKMKLGPYFGFASRQNSFTWQQSNSGSPNEEFADQFLGWTFNKWANSAEGTARKNWMDQYMPGWIDKAGNVS